MHRFTRLLGCTLAGRGATLSYILPTSCDALIQSLEVKMTYEAHLLRAQQRGFRFRLGPEVSGLIPWKLLT